MKKTRIHLDYAQMPGSPPAKFVSELEVKLSGINAYPDISYNEPRNAIAGHLGLDLENVCLGNGADELIDIITLTYGKKIIIAAPTFGQYEEAAKRHGCKYTVVPCLEDKRFGLEKLRPYFDVASLIWICNPNNPMGFDVDKNEVINVLKNTKAKVAVDEAYFEFYGQTLTEEIKNFDNLIIIRTFSKGFGLAGLRAGYALANQSVIVQINKVRQPFNLNYLASCAIPIALRHEKEFQPRIKAIEKTREMFSSKMTGLGYAPYPSKTNFATVSFDSPEDAKKVFDFLENRGIIVLPPWDSEFTGMPLNTLRITIGTEDQMRKVLIALEGYAKDRAK